MTINPNYQQQQCSPGILVSRKVCFMPIFVGVCWGGGEAASNESGVAENGDFRLFRSVYLPTLYIQGRHYYSIMYSRLMDFQWHWNRWPWWPWIAVLRYNLSSAWHPMRWRVLALRHKCSETCTATHIIISFILSAEKMQHSRPKCQRPWHFTWF